MIACTTYLSSFIFSFAFVFFNNNTATWSYVNEYERATVIKRTIKLDAIKKGEAE
jgi:hypothetical protein